MVVIKDSVPPTLEAAAGSMPEDVRSVQMTGDVGSQRSTRGANACQEEIAEVGFGLGGLVVSSTAKTATAVNSESAGNDGMAKVEKVLERLKAKNFTLHEQLVAEMSAHARALTDTV